MVFKRGDFVIDFLLSIKASGCETFTVKYVSFTIQHHGVVTVGQTVLMNTLVILIGLFCFYDHLDHFMPQAVFIIL